MKYYTYMLIDPRTDSPFYIGKGTGDRAWSHLDGKAGTYNTYKDNKINKILQLGLCPHVEIVEYFEDEKLAYDSEARLIESIGLDNLTNICPDARPPSKLGWHPSSETLRKRSESLKGIPRSEEWKRNLSKSKTGKNNPRYGTKENPETTESRRLAQLHTKNAHKYDLYKQALELLSEGMSYGNVSKTLGISKTVCGSLANGSHGFLEIFPELRKFCRR